MFVQGNLVMRCHSTLKQKGSSITPWAVVLVTRRRSLMSLHVLHYVTLGLRLGMGGLAQGTFGLSPRAYVPLHTCFGLFIA